jgi:2-polyprenyl-6-methoxyphenol hydroxylase-like FAD-dependent oxidoreductase
MAAVYGRCLWLVRTAAVRRPGVSVERRVASHRFAHQNGSPSLGQYKMRTQLSSSQSRRAIIIGGSIAGLFAALHLRRAGWRVDVYERATEPLSARGAGIMTHPELRAALAQFGIETDTDFGVAINERVVLDRHGAVTAQAHCPQIATSWTHVHSALLARLPATFLHHGADLVRITETVGGVTAHFADGRSATGNVLVGADGVRSAVRRHLFPNHAPQYAGYVAWRGLAPEPALLKHADDVRRCASFAFGLPPGEQMLSYLVPGPGHALVPGQRSINFVWYRPADATRDLPILLTDRTGTTHANAIPPTLIAPEVIAQMRAAAERLLAPWFQRVVAATAQPFLQPIFDLTTPRMHHGRIALIGDAAFVVRPHVGGGVVKAAEDAAALAEALALAEVAPSTALAAFSNVRTPVGEGMVAQARRLGSYLKSTYASDAERAEAAAAALPDAVLRETAMLAHHVRPA